LHCVPSVQARNSARIFALPATIRKPSTPLKTSAVTVAL